MNHYCAGLVDELYQLGVREVVISPGSRSTPLALLFCHYEKYKVYLNVDERSAGFFALGIAKAKQRPVVVLCTSGSAGTHYFPAVSEARYGHVPLIILTADRPPELQQVGAPQTIQQTKIFGEFVNYYEELAIFSGQEGVKYAREVSEQAYFHCRYPACGPVQINIPLREPLVPEWSEIDFSEGRKSVYFKTKLSTGKGIIEPEIANYFSNKKGILVCGGQLTNIDQKAILKFAESHRLPIIADPLSNLRKYASPNIMDSYDGFLKQQEVIEELTPEYVICFGDTLVSKRLYQFLKLYASCLCIQVNTNGDYHNPALLQTQQVVSDIPSFLASLSFENSTDSYLEKWQKWQKKGRNLLNQVSEISELFEGKIIHLLQNSLPNSSNLVIANSMPIRDVDYFWQAKEQNIQLFGNRGTNGIDGTISTALGIATSQKPTILLTGDLAFYHDMNGLLVGKTHQIPLVIVLLNNDGGGIFQYLPQKGQTHFDYLFSTPHGMDFAGVKTLYGLEYAQVENYEMFEIELQKALLHAGISVIEVKTNKERSFDLHEIYTNI